MIDSAIREFLIGLLSTIIPIEPAAAPGDAILRTKTARVVLSAIIDPEDYPGAPEPPPDGGVPSGNPSADRAWAIRRAAGAGGFRLLKVHADGSVDLRLLP